MIRCILTALLCAAMMPAASPAPRRSPNFVVHLVPPSGQVTPAQYKGKVVILAMIQTTCSHCQQTTQLLSGLQKEYESRGLQVMAAGFENGITPQVVSAFIRQFRPTFPVGYATRAEVLAYLGRDAADELWVPVLVFIDRKGMIRYQYLGDDPFYQNQEKNLRKNIEALLKEPAAGGQAAPAAKRKES